MKIDTTQNIVIPLSKTKIVFLFLGAFIFVAVSAWLWTISESQARFNPYYVKIVAAFGIAFFFLCGVYGVVKFFDGKPGLILGPTGIIDNSSGVSAGHISWEEIVDIDILSIGGQKFLTLFVVEPSKYVEKGNFFKRKLHTANLKLYGSPIQISSNSLKIDFQSLTELVGHFYYQYKTQ